MGQWTALQFDYPGYIDGYTNGTPRVIQLGLRLASSYDSLEFRTRASKLASA